MGSTSTFVDSDTLRTGFAGAMSFMYRMEVPLYGDLVEIVRNVNLRVLQQLEHGENQSDYEFAIRASSERLA